MANVAFSFQHAKNRAHAGITRLVREPGLDLRPARAPEREKNIHNLPFPPAQRDIGALSGDQSGPQSSPNRSPVGLLLSQARITTARLLSPLPRPAKAQGCRRP